jgi:dolichyl-phosphate-mannose--protein O-mannosyl transferase
VPAERGRAPVDEIPNDSESHHAPDEGALEAPALPPAPDEGPPDQDSPPVDPPVWKPPPRIRLRGIDRLVLLVIVAATATIYLARLGEPSRLLQTKEQRAQCVKWPTYHTNKCWEMIPLDEVHYIPDARDVLRFGTESDTRVPTGDDGNFVVHPPAAKWFIALGIWLWGDQPFGWRFFGALFGIWGVLVMYLLALRLWRSTWWAAMAATLLAVDGLWFVQSRVAMLDIYAASFFLTGFWLLVVDRDRTSPDHRGKRWWRIGAALMFGLAAASKYPVETGLFVIIAIVTSWVWESRKAPLARAPQPFTRRFIAAIGTFVIIPAAVYVASYTPWFVDSHRYNPPRCANVTAPSVTKSVGLHGVATVLERWGCYQVEILDFHRHLQKFLTKDSTPAASASGPSRASGTGSTRAPAVPAKVTDPAHPYFGNGISWPWIGRPVAHYYYVANSGKPDQRDIEVIGIPNPLVWWAGFFIALPLLLWWTILRRDDLAVVLLAFFLAGWLPYVLADAVNRPVFLFYATPLVPFVVLSVVHVLYRMVWRWHGARLVAAIFIGGALILFGYFYPVLAGVPIPHDGFFGWSGHMWFSHDCNVEHKVKMLCWI